eukprot:6195234-Pleurochrysis_carterae.AAC.1
MAKAVTTLGMQVFVNDMKGPMWRVSVAAKLSPDRLGFVQAIETRFSQTINYSVLQLLYLISQIQEQFLNTKTLHTKMFLGIEMI